MDPSFELRADKTMAARVVVDELRWTNSPVGGVRRRMLERDGGEVAAATSIVSYAPGSRFPEHVHQLGEEFLVLSGVFSDEHGDYGRGTYVRNPWGSRHAPFSTSGCEIFVKLRQLDSSSERLVVMPGTNRLFDSAVEHVFLVNLEPGEQITSTNGFSLEVLLLEGALSNRSADATLARAWFRFPAFEPVTLTASAATRAWVKELRL